MRARGKTSRGLDDNPSVGAAKYFNSRTDGNASFSRLAGANSSAKSPVPRGPNYDFLRAQQLSEAWSARVSPRVNRRRDKRRGSDARGTSIILGARKISFEPGVKSSRARGAASAARIRGIYGVTG